MFLVVIESHRFGFASAALADSDEAEHARTFGASHFCVQRTRHGWNHNTHYWPSLLALCPPRCRRALDVGCGSGALSQELSRVSDSVLGIDVDVRVLDATGDFDVRCGDFSSLDLLPGFDFIVFSASIHHMDFRDALQHGAALLRPGGVLAVLGLARSTHAVDWAMDALGFVASRLYRLRRRLWHHSAALAVPQQSYTQVRRTSAELLTGVTYRRLLLFRYLLVWQRPA